MAKRGWRVHALHYGVKVNTPIADAAVCVSILAVPLPWRIRLFFVFGFVFF
jgi:hypothetical protein